MEQGLSKVAPSGKHPSNRRALAELFLCYTVVVLSIALAEHLPLAQQNSFVKNGLYLITAIFMILVPSELAFRRGFDIDLFGLGFKNLAYSIKWAIILMAIIFPPYVVGFHFFQIYFKHRQFVEFAILPNTGQLLFQHIFMVGLPEEFFYRGYLQRELERMYPKSYFSLLGVEIGPAFLFASALFALGHLALLPAGFRLAVFFPSLMFGWLYKKTGNIGGGMLIHGVSNVLLFNLQSWYI